jgi:hypothetical protein
VRVRCLSILLSSSRSSLTLLWPAVRVPRPCPTGFTLRLSSCTLSAPVWSQPPCLLNMLQGPRPPRLLPPVRLCGVLCPPGYGLSIPYSRVHLSGQLAVGFPPAVDAALVVAPLAGILCLGGHSPTLIPPRRCPEGSGELHRGTRRQVGKPGRAKNNVGAVSTERAVWAGAQSVDRLQRAGLMATRPQSRHAGVRHAVERLEGGMVDQGLRERCRGQEGRRRHLRSDDLQAKATVPQRSAVCARASAVEAGSRQMDTTTSTTCVSTQRTWVSHSALAEDVHRHPCGRRDAAQLEGRAQEEQL